MKANVLLCISLCTLASSIFSGLNQDAPKFEKLGDSNLDLKQLDYVKTEQGVTKFLLKMLSTSAYLNKKYEEGLDESARQRNEKLNKYVRFLCRLEESSVSSNRADLLASLARNVYSRDEKEFNFICGFIDTEEKIDSLLDEIINAKSMGEIEIIFKEKPEEKLLMLKGTSNNR
ncbi:MAG: hypothetical protein OXE99_12385 [Cellvibrionales bacterium]|nr:hypothetical protein [Cellvibrionales bacterium]